MATFDAGAEAYDRARPGYPAEAFADLVALCGLDAASTVLEIGCGTGQATRDLAPLVGRVRCVERGPALANLAHVNLTGLGNVEVTTSTFERFESDERFDAIVSATAFHWLDPAVAYPKVASLLRPGGHLALLTNAHGAGGTHTDARITPPLRDLHRRLAPEIGDWTFATYEEIAADAMAGGDIAAVWSRIDRRVFEPVAVSELFDPPTVRTYSWLATYDRDGYLEMLGTQSSYGLMEPGRRADLLARIGALVDEHLGGTVTKEYVTVLAVASRPTPDEAMAALEAELARHETPGATRQSVLTDLDIDRR